MGGGVAGQAGAIRHGLARAILKFDPASKLNLERGPVNARSENGRTQKARKAKARKRFQFSKR